MGTVNVISGGLDVQAIVDGFISIESAPITRMQSQTSSLQTKITAFQSLNTKLSSLLSKVEQLLYNGDTAPLSTPDSFEERLASSVFSSTKATSSDEAILKATASAGAASGTYSITVAGLAKTQADLSSGFAAANTPIADRGTLEISVNGGTAVPVVIDDTNNTLQGLMQAINAADAGVTATIINDGTETPYKLVINSNQTGKASGFIITQAEGWTGTSLTFTNKVAADDAHIIVNGIDIYRASNTISDVIADTTLELKSTNLSPVTVTVAPDLDAMASAVKDLVSAYNDVNSAISSQSRYNPQTKTSGPLSGDSTLRSIQAKLQSIMAQSVSNDHSSFSVLAQAGIRFNNDGSLKFDESKFREVAADNPSSIAALFIGEGASAPSSGPMVNLRKAIDNITDPLSGPIHNSTEALSNNIKTLNDRISDYKERLEIRRELLTAEFARADEALRLLNVNQASLSSQTASLASLL